MPTFEGVVEVTVAAPATEELPTPAQDLAELLRAAAYLVGQPGGWTQHYLGRLKDGTGTYVRTMLRSGEIQSRCMLGALYSEYDRNPAPNIHLAYDAIVRTIGTGLVADWNDAPGRTQEDVVGALLHAAEFVEA
jgi:class 3 adenylate cyclase